MDAFLEGFSEELTKIAVSARIGEEDLKELYRELKEKTKAPRSKLSRFGRTAKRTGADYATPAAIGAAVTPLMTILMAKGKRGLHNQEVRRLIKQTASPEMAAKLRSQIYKGRTFGRSNLGKNEYERAIMTPRDAAFDIGRGAAAGSLVQWVRRQMKKED